MPNPARSQLGLRGSDHWIGGQVSSPRGGCLYTLVILSLLYTAGVDLEEESEKETLPSLTMGKW